MHVLLHFNGISFIISYVNYDVTINVAIGIGKEYNWENTGYILPLNIVRS